MERLRRAKHRVSSPRRRTVEPPDSVRRRALACLYARRSAVNSLIGAIERYQREQSRSRPNGAPLTDGEMSS